MYIFLKCQSFSLLDTARKGKLFTLFLHNPLVAFLYVCNIADVQAELWEQCCQQLQGFEEDWVRLFTKWSKLIGTKFHKSHIETIGQTQFSFSYVKQLV